MGQTTFKMKEIPVPLYVVEHDPVERNTLKIEKEER